MGLGRRAGGAGKGEGLAPRRQMWGAASSQPGDATDGHSQNKCSDTSELEASRRGSGDGRDFAGRAVFHWGSWGKKCRIRSRLMKALGKGLKALHPGWTSGDAHPDTRAPLALPSAMCRTGATAGASTGCLSLGHCTALLCRPSLLLTRTTMWAPRPSGVSTQADTGAGMT